MHFLYYFESGLVDVLCEGTAYSVDNIPIFLPRGPSHSAAKSRFTILFGREVLGPIFDFFEYENTATRSRICFYFPFSKWLFGYVSLPALPGGQFQNK